MTTLTAALSAWPETPSETVRLDRVAVSPISKAFAPMVRELRYDLSEMAIATLLMAKEAGVPITLLPVVMVQRFQEGALLCRADSDIAGPADRDRDPEGQCPVPRRQGAGRPAPGAVRLPAVRRRLGRAFRPPLRLNRSRARPKCRRRRRS